MKFLVNYFPFNEKVTTDQLSYSIAEPAHYKSADEGPALEEIADAESVDEPQVADPANLAPADDEPAGEGGVPLPPNNPPAPPSEEPDLWSETDEDSESSDDNMDEVEGMRSRDNYCRRANLACKEQNLCSG